MGALTASVIAIVAIGLGWASIEIACKPCLEQGRQAIDRNLNPDYDPDVDVRAPFNPSPLPPPPASLVKDASHSSATSTTVVKIV